MYLDIRSQQDGNSYLCIFFYSFSFRARFMFAHSTDQLDGKKKICLEDTDGKKVTKATIDTIGVTR